MRNRRFAILSGILALLLVVASTGYYFYEREEREAKEAGKKEFPPALASHLEKLKEAIPGNGGESGEGPGSAAADEFFQRAYPDTDIPLARIEAAQAAFNVLKWRASRSCRARASSTPPHTVLAPGR